MAAPWRSSSRAGRSRPGRRPVIHSTPLRLVGLTLIAMGAMGCGGGDRSPSGPAPVPSPAPTPAATARYAVTFEASWSALTHPTDFPANAHFSPLIGATHGSRVGFWRTGESASPGIHAVEARGGG